MAGLSKASADRGVMFLHERNTQRGPPQAQMQSLPKPQRPPSTKSESQSCQPSQSLPHPEDQETFRSHQRPLHHAQMPPQAQTRESMQLPPRPRLPQNPIPMERQTAGYQPVPVHVNDQNNSTYQYTPHPFAVSRNPSPSALANGLQPPPPHPMHLPVLQQPVLYVPSPLLNGTEASHARHHTELNTCIRRDERLRSPSYSQSSMSRNTNIDGRAEMEGCNNMVRGTTTSPHASVGEHSHTGRKMEACNSRTISDPGILDTRGELAERTISSYNDMSYKQSSTHDYMRADSQCTDGQRTSTTVKQEYDGEQSYNRGARFETSVTQKSPRGDLTHPPAGDIRRDKRGSQDVQCERKSKDPPGTSSRRSSSIHSVEHLLSGGNSGSVYKPHATQSTRIGSDNGLRYSTNRAECVATETRGGEAGTPAHQPPAESSQQMIPGYARADATLDSRPITAQSQIMVPGDEKKEPDGEHSGDAQHETGTAVAPGERIVKRRDRKKVCLSRSEKRRRNRLEKANQNTLGAGGKGLPSPKKSSGFLEGKLGKLTNKMEKLKAKRDMLDAVEEQIKEVEETVEKLRLKQLQHNAGIKNSSPVVEYSQNHPDESLRPPGTETPPKVPEPPKEMSIRSSQQPLPRNPKSQPLPNVKSHTSRQPQAQQVAHHQQPPQPPPQLASPLRPHASQPHTLSQPSSSRHLEQQALLHSRIVALPHTQIITNSQTPMSAQARQLNAHANPYSKAHQYSHPYISAHPRPYFGASSHTQVHAPPHARWNSKPHVIGSGQMPPKARVSMVSEGMNIDSGAYGLGNRHNEPGGNADNRPDVGKMYTAYSSQGGQISINDRGGIAWKCEFKGCGIIFAVKDNRDNHYQKAHIDNADKDTPTTAEATKHPAVRNKLPDTATEESAEPAAELDGERARLSTVTDTMSAGGNQKRQLPSKSNGHGSANTSEDDEPLISLMRPVANKEPMKKKQRLGLTDESTSASSIKTEVTEVTHKTAGKNLKSAAGNTATTKTAKRSLLMPTKNTTKGVKSVPTSKSGATKAKKRTKEGKVGDKQGSKARQKPKRTSQKKSGLADDGDVVVLLTESDLFPTVEAPPDKSPVSPVAAHKVEPPISIGLFAPATDATVNAVPRVIAENIADSAQGRVEQSSERANTAKETHTLTKTSATPSPVKQSRKYTPNSASLSRLNLPTKTERQRKHSYSSVGSEDADMTVGLFGPETSTPSSLSKGTAVLDKQSGDGVGSIAESEPEIHAELEGDSFVELTEADIFGLSEPSEAKSEGQTAAVRNPQTARQTVSVADSSEPPTLPEVVVSGEASPEIVELTESDLFGTEVQAATKDGISQFESENEDTNLKLPTISDTAKESMQSKPREATEPAPVKLTDLYGHDSEGSGEDDSEDEADEHAGQIVEELTMADLGLEKIDEDKARNAKSEYITARSFLEPAHPVGASAKNATPESGVSSSTARKSQPPKLLRIPKEATRPRQSALDILLSRVPKGIHSNASAMGKTLLNSTTQKGDHNDGPAIVDRMRTLHGNLASESHVQSSKEREKIDLEASLGGERVNTRASPSIVNDSLSKINADGSGRSRVVDHKLTGSAMHDVRSESALQDNNPLCHTGITQADARASTDTTSSVQAAVNPKRTPMDHRSASASSFAEKNRCSFTIDDFSPAAEVDATASTNESTHIHGNSSTDASRGTTTHTAPEADDLSEVVRTDSVRKVGLFAHPDPETETRDRVPLHPIEADKSVEPSEIETSDTFGVVYPPGTGLCRESLRALGYENPRQTVVDRIARFQELAGVDRICPFVSFRMSMASSESDRDAVQRYSEAIEHLLINTKRLGGGSCVSHLPMNVSAKDVDRLHPSFKTNPTQTTDRQEDMVVLSQLYTKRAICRDKLKNYIKAEKDCVDALTWDSENLECMLAYARMQMARGCITQVVLSLKRAQFVLDNQNTPSHEHSFSDELHTLSTIVEKLKSKYKIIKDYYEPNLEGYDSESTEQSTQYSGILVRAIKVLQSRCPRSVNCQLWYARYLRLGLGDLEAAIALLTEVYESGPVSGLVPLVAELSLCAYENADFETVITIVDDNVLDGDSDTQKIDKATKMTIGQLRVGMKQRLEKSQTLCLWRREGKLAFNRGDFQEAAESYTRAIDMKEPYHRTNIAICLNNKAMCLMQVAKGLKQNKHSNLANNRLKEAMDCCDRALILKPNYIKSKMRKAGVFTLCGDFAENLTTRLRQYKRAKEVYEDVLRMQPENQELKDIFSLLAEKMDRANSDKRILDERTRREQEVEEEKIREELHRAETARKERKSRRKQSSHTQQAGERNASRTLYTVLGVSPSATTEEIKRAYRTLAKTHHPDRNRDGDPAKFQELLKAHNTLIDPRLRKEYDRVLIRTTTGNGLTFHYHS